MQQLKYERQQLKEVHMYATCLHSVYYLPMAHITYSSYIVTYNM